MCVCRTLCRADDALRAKSVSAHLIVVPERVMLRNLPTCNLQRLSSRVPDESWWSAGWQFWQGWIMQIGNDSALQQAACAQQHQANSNRRDRTSPQSSMIQPAICCCAISEIPRGDQTRDRPNDHNLPCGCENAWIPTAPIQLHQRFIDPLAVWTRHQFGVLLQNA